MATWRREARRRLRPSTDYAVSIQHDCDLRHAASYPPASDDHCCGMPAASRTLFHRTSSALMCLPNASGVDPRTTTPALVNRALSASSAITSLTAALSLAITADGVPRGANKPYQLVTS